MTSDVASVLAICGGIILLPFVAVFMVWYLRHLNRANVKTLIRMGDSWCYVNKDGTVDIHQPRTFNVIAIVIIWFFVELFVLALTVGSNANGVITGILVLAVAAVAVVCERYVLRADRFRLDPQAKALIIRHGSSAETIGFSRIRGLVVTYVQVVLRSRYGTSISYVARMTFALDNSGSVVIGAPAGSAQNIQQHAKEIVDVLSAAFHQDGAPELAVEYENTELN